MSARRIMLCAVEPSGDALGAALMKALRAQGPDIFFCGCGGAAMAAEGLGSAFDISALSVFGIADMVNAAPKAMRHAAMLRDLAVSEEIDGAVFIDSWAFSALAAGKIKRARPQAALIKYVGPQIWASRSWRAKKAAALFDGMLCLFDFERSFYEAHGLDIAVAGHSGFQELSARPLDGAGFRERHKIGDAPLLAVLPGSRAGEARRLAASFRETLDLLASEHPDLRIVVAPAPANEAAIDAMFAGWRGAAPIVAKPDERYDAYAAADAALAALGTVAAELAITGTPAVIAYRVDPLSALFLRRMRATPFFALPNLAAGAAIMPEFLQEDCQASALAPALSALLKPGAARDRQRAAFEGVIGRLAGSAPAADAAATAVIRWINEKNAETS